MTNKMLCAACGFEGKFHLLMVDGHVARFSLIRFTERDEQGGSVRVCPKRGTFKFIKIDDGAVLGDMIKSEFEVSR